MRAPIVVAACPLVAGCGGSAERDRERLDRALSDGTIVATRNGARHWKTTFRP